MKAKLLIVLFFLTTSVYTQTLPTGHFGVFEFTEGNLWNQSSGPSLIGNMVPGPDRFGNINAAVGSSQILNGHILGNGTGYDHITLSFWIKSGTPTSTERIIQIYGTGGNGFRLSFDATNLYLNAKGTSNNGSVVDIAASENINLGDNQWHNIVIRTKTISGGYVLALDILVDGVVKSNVSALMNPPGSSFITTFLDDAEMIVNPTNTYSGSIDDIYFYKSALTFNQITSLYNYTPVVNGQFTYFVDKDATGNNDGTSWVDAFTDLQSALAAVNSGNEIWIAKGTYKPSVSNRGTYFRIIRAGLSIYGGFAGTEVDIDQRVRGQNETILSGDLLGNDVNVADYPGSYFNTSRNTDNSYRIIHITSGGDELHLDGLTISDSHTNIDANTHGGAILKDPIVRNLEITNCIIKNNVSRNFAAGILADFDLGNVNGQNANVTIDGCQFTNNMSRSGSGIYTTIKSDTKVNFTITNSVFDNNIAADISPTTKGQSGSAIWIRSSGHNTEGSFSLGNNTFVNNKDTGTNNLADDRYRAPLVIGRFGNFNNTNDNAIVANCIFWNNTGLNDHVSTNGFSRAISDMSGVPIASVKVYNSLDALNFVEGSINSSVNTLISDPLFSNISNNHYTLTSSSPAVNTGDNNYVSGAIDFLGNQRIFNTTVDIGAYEFGASPLSVEKNPFTHSEIRVYPNPVSENLYVDINQEVQKIQVYNLLGKVVLEKENSAVVNLSQLKQGMYLIQITSDKKVYSKRIIKN